MSDAIPPLLSPKLDTLPADLTDRPQWVVWRGVWQPDKQKWSKPPTDAKNGRAGKSTGPETWADFETARRAYLQKPGIFTDTFTVEYGGVGFVVTEADPFAAVDLDHVIVEDGGERRLTEEAARIVALLDTYTEVSPSGTGLRLFVRANLPPGRRIKGDVEMYETGKFLTVTGRRWPGTPAGIEARQAEIETLHRQVFPPEPPKAKAAAAEFRPDAVPQDDSDLLSLAVQARNGSKIGLLLAGNTSAHGDDASAADLALCSSLAFWTGPDAHRLDRLFRGSGLMRDKWDKRHYADGRTYGAATVQKAIDGCSRFYGDESRADRTERRRKEKAEKHKVQGTAACQASGLPQIEVNARHLRFQTDDALAALLAGNDPPTVFVRSGDLVGIVSDEKKRPILRRLPLEGVRAVLARRANFVSTSDDRGTVPVTPPRDVVEDLMQLSPWPGVPPLESVVTSPVLAPDGQIVTTPGYHRAACAFYHPQDDRPLPDTTPTPANVQAAVQSLRTLIDDFPFVDEASRTNALACLLTPFVRPAIAGPTPLHLFDAPTRGTGKSLLAKALARVFVGEEIGATTEADNEEEWRKRLSAALSEGTAIIFLDNIKKRLSSSALEALLTSTQWSDRLLGRNDKTIRLPNRATWIATGNNLQMDDEMPRRAVWIRLDAGVEKPEDRTGFQIADLDGYIDAERPHLVAAVVTLLRFWVKQGRPAWSGRLMGSFESYCRIVGGVLETAGFSDFLSNRKDLYERADTETTQWAAFFREWHAAVGTREVRVADLLEMASNADLIVYSEDKKRSAQTKFGAMLRQKRDRVFGGLQLCSRDSAGALYWLKSSSQMQPRLLEPIEPLEPFSTAPCLSKKYLNGSHNNIQNFVDTPEPVEKGSKGSIGSNKRGCI